MATYWNALGLSGSAVSATVENAAKSVQWAMFATSQGASKNEAKIRYNLDVFWKDKAAAYPGESAEGRLQLEKLDSMAHGIWNALETGKIYSASPSYGEFYLHNVVLGGRGGAPSRPDSDAAAIRAKVAAEKASNASTRAIQPSLTDFYTRTAASIPQHKSAASELWTQEGMSFLGIPVWAWLAGAGMLGILILTRD